MPFALPRARALYALLVVSVALSVPTRARAQAVLGYGEDATAAPAGAIRFRLSNDWHRSRLIGNASDTTYDSDRQFRATTIGLELGVLSRFTLGVTAPWVMTKTETFVSSSHLEGFHFVTLLDTLLTSTHNGWGNIEAFGKIVWLGEPGQQARLAPRSGVHIRSAIVGGALLGTGNTVPTSDPFAIPTSDRAKAITARSATDVTIGRLFFASIVGRYEKPFSDNYLVGVHPGDNPFSSDAVPVFAQRKLGTTYEIEFTPRFQLGRYFSAGLQYRYHHHAQDFYTGTTTTTIGATPVTLDAATLDTGTAFTEQRVGFGVVYSAVDAYVHRNARFPVEVTFEFSKVTSISGNRPKEEETMISVRLYRRLWGAEFAPPPRAPKTSAPAPDSPSP